MDLGWYSSTQSWAVFFFWGGALEAFIRSTELFYAPVCHRKFTRNAENSVGAVGFEAEVSLLACTTSVKTVVNTSGRPPMNNRTADRSDRRQDLEYCSKQLSRRATNGRGE